MSKKKLSVIIVTIIVVLALIICWILFGRNGGKESYIIKEWNNFAQNVEITISDDTIIKATKSSEPDNNTGAITGGENSIITITGLKEGNANVIVTVLNSDGTTNSKKTYFFKVNKNLKVKLTDTKTN